MQPWMATLYVGRANIELTELSASASRMLGLKMYASMPGLFHKY